MQYSEIKETSRVGVTFNIDDYHNLHNRMVEIINDQEAVVDRRLAFNFIVFIKDNFPKLASLDDMPASSIPLIDLP